MRLISVNVSLPKSVKHEGKTVRTGIFKQPVAGRVMVRKLNIDGDKQADLRFHGGAEKAVYAYPHEHYAFWQRELRRNDLAPGQFGENLTIDGILETDVHLGDVFRVGNAVLQVTKPRIPCYKLGIRMGDPDFPTRYFKAARSGFYLRVLQEGDIGAGDSIEWVEHSLDTPTIHADFVRRRQKDEAEVV